MTAHTDELEREIEASRSRLDAALGNLQDRLHPASVADELIGIGRRSGVGGEIYDLALGTVRRNPVPILLICVGAPLLLSSARRGTDAAPWNRPLVPRRGPAVPQRRRAARLYPG